MSTGWFNFAYNQAVACSNCGHLRDKLFSQYDTTLNTFISTGYYLCNNCYKVAQQYNWNINCSKCCNIIPLEKTNRFYVSDGGIVCVKCNALKGMFKQQVKADFPKCPDCKGTGVYRGFNTVEACKACGGNKTQ